MQVRIWEQPGTSNCAAFLANNNTRQAQIIRFRGQQYSLPARSISILPDCKTVVFNTQMVKTTLPSNYQVGESFALLHVPKLP